MLLLKLLMFTLTFYELVHLDASKAICKKGERVENGRCVICHEGTFQLTENESKRCHGACRKCDEKSGSFSVTPCTNMRNAECRCRSGFVPSDSDYSTCKCDIGFGLSGQGVHKECSKCEHGYFNAQINSDCKKWKECKSVGTPGTTTSDVICSNTSATIHAIPTKVIFKPSTSRHPQVGTENQKVHSTAATSTTSTTKSSSASDRHTATPNDKVQPSYPASTGNYIGMALLIFGIVGLLVLTAVTCKLHISPYLEKQPGKRKNENESCRRPVEESGDDSRSPLKRNAEEP